LEDNLNGKASKSREDKKTMAKFSQLEVPAAKYTQDPVDFFWRKAHLHSMAAGDTSINCCTAKATIPIKETISLRTKATSSFSRA